VYGAKSGQATGEITAKVINEYVHNICVYVNVNSTRPAAFRDCQGLIQGEDFKLYRPLVDGGIRWNSTEAMISCGTAALKLDKYFKLLDCSPLYTAAIVLHPARRFEYFEDKWADHPSWIKNARKIFKGLFLKYEESFSPVNLTSESSDLQGESSTKGGSSTYLVYDGFSADYLLRRGQKQLKRKKLRDSGAR
jgi:hypothetical protein